jgi:uncharacterized protein (TIGR02284 family)
MSNQTNQVENVANAIQVMKGGIEFYKEAINEVDTPHIKQTFRKMVQQKHDAIDILQPFAISEKGAIEDKTDWLVDTRKMYTKFIGKMIDDQGHTYVKQLEEVEDKVLEVLDEAMKKDQPTDCMASLRRVKASAQQMHDEMKALQNATA